MELLRHLSLTLFLITLVACGGGILEGGDEPSDGVSAPSNILTIPISDRNVTKQSLATITSTLSMDGSAVGGEVITFRTSLGSFYQKQVPH